jgi:hypothetical protein
MNSISTSSFEPYSNLNRPSTAESLRRRKTLIEKIKKPLNKTTSIVLQDSGTKQLNILNKQQYEAIREFQEVSKEDTSDVSTTK